jgi:hypothetical protein
MSIFKSQLKQAFKKFTHAHGVRVEHYHAAYGIFASNGVKDEVEHYHADNGIFTSNGFKDKVKKCGQSITFCGVGAHHQNGVAERRIQDLSDSARSMLLRENQAKSPDELFSKTAVRPTTRFLHVFRAPVYVLHSDLQGGKSIPKWNERSRVGVHLGNSRMHASSVSLILNPNTGYVSPQFHCIYDDQFNLATTNKSFYSVWAEKAGLQQQVFDKAPANDYARTVIPQ